MGFMIIFINNESAISFLHFQTSIMVFFVRVKFLWGLGLIKLSEIENFF